MNHRAIAALTLAALAASACSAPAAPAPTANPTPIVIYVTPPPVVNQTPIPAASSVQTPEPTAFIAEPTPDVSPNLFLTFTGAWNHKVVAHYEHIAFCTRDRAANITGVGVPTSLEVAGESRALADQWMLMVMVGKGVELGLGPATVKDSRHYHWFYTEAPGLASASGDEVTIDALVVGYGGPNDTIHVTGKVLCP